MERAPREADIHLSILRDAEQTMSRTPCAQALSQTHMQVAIAVADTERSRYRTFFSPSIRRSRQSPHCAPITLTDSWAQQQIKWVEATFSWRLSILLRCMDDFIDGFFQGV